jgi:DNA-binding MarR family transcriptional regulator
VPPVADAAMDAPRSPVADAAVDAPRSPVADAAVDAPRSPMANAAVDAPRSLEDIVGFHIRLAHGAVYRHFNDTFGAIGLTQKQTSVLWLVSDDPGISQIDLARRLQIDRATMMAITNTLAKRGLLDRRSSMADRRRQTLHLTAAGVTALAAARQAVAAHEAWLKSRFTPDEACRLVELLQRIHKPARTGAAS